jgi:hypothetical protein
MSHDGFARQQPHIRPVGAGGREPDHSGPQSAPEDHEDPRHFPRVVSGAAPDGAAPYPTGYAAPPHMHAPPSPQMPGYRPPHPGAGYDHPQMHPGYAPQGAGYGPPPGGTPYGYAVPHAPPPAGAPHGWHAAADPRAGHSEPMRAPQAARLPRRALAPAVRHYGAGRLLARSAMVLGALLIVLAVLSPVLIVLGLAAAAGGVTGVALLGVGLAGAGLTLLLAGQMAIALFDQADAARDLAAIERAKWAEEARRDASA